MEDLADKMEQKMELARTYGRMSILSEITEVLAQAIQTNRNIKQFAEMFVNTFCQPAMKDTIEILHKIGDNSAGDNDERN